MIKFDMIIHCLMAVSSLAGSGPCQPTLCPYTALRGMTVADSLAVGRPAAEKLLYVGRQGPMI